MCPKVTEQHREAVRDEILNAAERVFAKSGYHVASMDDIVEESGLSKGAIYGHFGSKEELFIALEERTQPASLGQMVQTVASGASAMDRLQKAGELAMQHQAAMARDTCRLAYEFWTEAPRLKSVQRVYLNRYRDTHEFLAGLVRDGIKSGEFRKDIDPDAIATVLMGAVDGMTLHWATIGIDLDWDRVLKSFIGVIRGGIVAPSRK